MILEETMGNFSRDTFDKLKHYVGVRLQQGVPLVDADWNEQEDIRKYELQAFIKWFIGDGVPSGNNGFLIESLYIENLDNDFLIKGGDGTPEGAGRCIVGGWDVINESDLRYQEQRLYNNNDLAEQWGVAPVSPLPVEKGNLEAVVYLDVWEREVDSDEDENIKNEAIGIETCVRLKREWVVRVAEGNEVPDSEAGHVHYLLAILNWLSDSGMIYPDNIRDRRGVCLPLAELTTEISEARGSHHNLGDRLNVLLKTDGELKSDVVKAENILDGSVNTDKIADDVPSKSYVDNLTGGTLSSSDDMENAATNHTRQINVSSQSSASGAWTQVNASYYSSAGVSQSQVNASYGSSTNVPYSQVNASYESAATGQLSQVNASHASMASGQASQVNSSSRSIANHSYSQVNASYNVVSKDSYTICGGWTSSEEPSESNRKWEIDSQSGNFYGSQFSIEWP